MKARESTPKNIHLYTVLPINKKNLSRATISVETSWVEMPDVNIPVLSWLYNGTSRESVVHI